MAFAKVAMFAFMLVGAAFGQVGMTLLCRWCLPARLS